MSFRVCAIVPSYNHYLAIGDVIARLRGFDLPVYVIDDGSGPAAAASLAARHDPARGVWVIRLPVNGGKGRAVREGFRQARQAGFTHALQVDADGQHDLSVVPRMLGVAARDPGTLVSGQAMFDRSVPLGRRIGRWITHVWVYVETLSFRITDALCGLRVYPLDAAIGVAEAEALGDRMDFDIAIMVHLSWCGVPVAMVPVRVTYPPGNTSNFHLWRDNLSITRMHTRLVLTMPGRLIGGRIKRPRTSQTATHWSALAELGAAFGLRIGIGVYRLIGRRGCLLVMAPVVVWFYLSAGARRRASRDFLERAFAAGGVTHRPGPRDGLRHFMRFAERILDTVSAWAGGMKPGELDLADPAALARLRDDPRGCILIVGHLGAADISRALLDPATRGRLLVLAHTGHALSYNRILQDVSPDTALNVIAVTDIGPDTAIALRDHVERGRWIVIAGDRTPVHGPSRIARVPFLGAPAPFSQGPYVLAALMECPVWLLFCRKEGKRYRLTVEPFAERIVLPRGARNAALAGHAARYAARLQAHALADPFQWYNFFDFWEG